MNITTILVKAKNLVDAVAMRIFIVIVGLTVPFVLLQPIICRAVFDESPPKTSTDVGSALSLIVTLLTFALAAYGVITYRYIKARLEQDLTAQITNKINDELQRGFNKMHALSARSALEQSLKEWRRYETELWSEKHDYDPEFEQEDVFIRSVDLAVQYGEDALEDVRELEVEESYELNRLRYDVVNNLAYHLASRRLDIDQQRALSLCDELGTLIPEMTQRELGVVVPSEPEQWDEDITDMVLWICRDALETIVWVNLRYNTVVEADGSVLFPEMSLAILKKLFIGDIFEPEDLERYEKKYEKLFGLRLEEVQLDDEERLQEAES